MVTDAKDVCFRCATAKAGEEHRCIEVRDTRRPRVRDWQCECKCPPVRFAPLTVARRSL